MIKLRNNFILFDNGACGGYSIKLINYCPQQRLILINGQAGLSYFNCFFLFMEALLGSTCFYIGVTLTLSCSLRLEGWGRKRRGEERKRKEERVRFNEKMLWWTIIRQSVEIVLADEFLYYNSRWVLLVSVFLLFFGQLYPPQYSNLYTPSPRNSRQAAASPSMSMVLEIDEW